MFTYILVRFLAKYYSNICNLNKNNNPKKLKKNVEKIHRS